MKPLRTLVRSVAIASLVVVLAALGVVGFLVVAPCTWHNPELMREAQLVAHAVERHVAAGGTLPLDGNTPIEGIPPDFFWSAVPESSGGFVVKHFGSATSGRGFDFPWVSYHSATGALECHDR